ncbi:hypothetical protein KFK09_000809 [Dendrobium nobile]|uniref:Uncharacterized protein n=1 Tax=Dendrobium nobile TaxID=94219 RepID=A0A8T3CC41_DENNO|nr:hypothetical protein KFK09_000809 [Dendrobium nobile]
MGEALILLPPSGPKAQGGSSAGVGSPSENRSEEGQTREQVGELRLGQGRQTALMGSACS